MIGYSTRKSGFSLFHVERNGLIVKFVVEYFSSFFIWRFFIVTEGMCCETWENHQIWQKNEEIFALNQSLKPVFGWLSGIQSVTTTNYILYQIFIGFFYTCNDGSNAFFCAVFVTRLCKKVIRCTISKMLSSILRTWWFLKECVGANKRFSFYLSSTYVMYDLKD